MKTVSFSHPAGPHEIFAAHAIDNLKGTFTKFTDAVGVAHQATIQDAKVHDGGRSIELVLGVPDEADLGDNTFDPSISFRSL